MEVIHDIALAVLIAAVIALVCYLGYMMERNYRRWKRRKALLLLLLLLPLCFVSCEKDVLRHAELESYYDESTHLNACTSDSITRFSSKVEAFVAVYPDAKEDPLYPPIIENINNAQTGIHITINDEWDGETYIEY